MTPIYPDHAVIMAPIAGHTDLPMRRSARRHGCRFAFTEMIDAGSLAFNASKTMNLITRGDDEDFLGVQLVGSDPDQLRKATEILNERHFDVLDFNLGCPAPKVARKCEGISFALKKPDDAVRAVELLVKTSRIPVTVKTRIQSETEPDLTVQFCKRLEDAGASAVTIHGRIMKLFYSGPVFYDIIRAVRETLKIQVIANGGAMTPETHRTLAERSTCPCTMLARGVLGNPWLFEQIQTPGIRPPTVAEFADELERHILEMVEYYGVDLAMRAGRKTILEYLRGRGYPGALRASVSFLAGLNGFKLFMDEVRKGPSWRYWEYLELHPDEVERPLSPASDEKKEKNFEKNGNEA